MQNFEQSEIDEFDDEMASNDEPCESMSQAASDLYARGTAQLVDRITEKERLSPEEKENIEAPKPLSAKEIEEFSKRIGTIIAKGSDFSYGGKNKQIQEMFGKAAAAGEESFKSLVAAVNKGLAVKGLDLKIDGKWQSNTEEKLLRTGDIMLTSYPPQYPNSLFRTTTSASAELTLRTKSGETEDSLEIKRVVSQSHRRGTYVPRIDRSQEKSILESLRLDKGDE